MLQDALSSNGYLLSQKEGSIAIAEDRTQQLADTDYRKMRDVRIRWYLANIGGGSILPDTFITAQSIQEGDELLIRRSTGNIESFIIPVSGITPISDGAYVIPTMVSVDLPYGHITSIGTSDPLYAFDADPSTQTGNIATNSSFTYQFHNNEPIQIESFYAKQGYSNTVDFIIEGSTDGVTYTTISTHTGARYDLYDGHDWVIDTPGLYSFYRFKVTSGSCYIKHIRFKGAGFQVDTTSVTSGDVPNISFIGQDEIKYNDVVLTEDLSKRVLNYGENHDRLDVYSIYNDCIFYPSRTLTTQYTFKIAGNVSLEHTGQIFNLWLKQGNTTMTDNTSPNDTVSVAGADAPLAADAYKIYNGDDTTESYSVATGVGGVVDLEHIYEFDTAKICYALRMTTSLAAQAPAEYFVYGSFDGIAWIELQHIQQGIAGNDLIRTQYFYNAEYDAYKFYKVHVVKGNTENDSVSAKQYVLLEEEIS